MVLNVQHGGFTGGAQHSVNRYVRATPAAVRGDDPYLFSFHSRAQRAVQRRDQDEKLEV
jgi:hypothetical protein